MAGDAACRLVLVRHGETDWNAAHRIQGQLDVPLNARGRAQAAAVAARLARELAGAGASVLSSDLSRAADTARAIAAALGVEMETSPALREQHLGELQGLEKREAESSAPASWRALRGGDAPGGGGESDEDVYKRVVRCLSEIASANPGRTVVAVSHSGALQQVHTHARGTRARESVRNTAVSVLEIRARGERGGEEWRVLAWNSDEHIRGTAHLEGGAAFNEAR